MKNMLLVFAHPDDESFATSITVAKYAKAGWSIHLLCATLGEAGESGPYENISGDALGAVRRAELEDAARILGISDVSFLGYRDGTIKNQETGELEDKIYRKMVELMPEVVITFDTTGISNHPDHIRICYITTYAFQKYTREINDTRNFVAEVNAGNPLVKKRNFAVHHKFALKQRSFTDVVESDLEPKLYFACMPESVATYLKKQKVIPEESFGKPFLGVADKLVTTVIEGERYKITKLKALAAHKSQSADVDRFYSIDTNPVSVREYFILRMQGETEVFMGKTDRVSDRL